MRSPCGHHTALGAGRIADMDEAGIGLSGYATRFSAA